MHRPDTSTHRSCGVGAATNTPSQRRRWLVAALGAAVGATTSGSARAATTPYPDRPLRLVVPFSAGGPTDVSARLIAEALSKVLSRAVVVDNRPGAGGNIAAAFVARASADGCTLLWAQSATHGVNPTLYAAPGYDARKDFAPVALLTTMPLVLVAAPGFAASDLPAVLTAARAAPGTLRFGSGGTGSMPHLVGELIAMQGQVRLEHVPYRGNAQAVADVMAGHIELLAEGPNTALPHIRAGRLKALAVTSAARLPQLPHVPSVAETVPGFEVIGWGGVVLPAATPQGIVDRLAAALRDVASQPELRARFADIGVKLEASTPLAMQRFVDREIDRWGVLVRRLNLKADE